MMAAIPNNAHLDARVRGFVCDTAVRGAFTLASASLCLATYTSAECGE